MGDVSNNRVLYSFKCNDADRIFTNGGSEMLEAEYAEYALPREEWLPDFNVTLAISTAGFPKTKKVKKSMTDEEQERIRQQNEEIRSQRQANIDKIATKIAMFKRFFIGAPIRKALLAAKESKPITPCEIAYRKDEKYWVTSTSPGSASFSFSFNFSN